MMKDSRWRKVICLFQLPGRVSNPRIRDDQELNEFCSNSDKMHRATSDDVHTKSMVWVQSIIYIPTICGKIGKDIELLNGSIYPCSILFSNLCSFNRKSEFRKPGNLNKPFTKGETTNVAELSLLKESLEKQPCSCYLDVRSGQFADRHMAVAWRRWLSKMPFSQRQWTVSPCKKLIPQVMFAFFGDQLDEQMSSFAAIFEVQVRQKSERVLQICAIKQLIRFSLLLSDLGTVALVIEGSDLSITEDTLAPTARCIQDTKEI